MVRIIRVRIRWVGTNRDGGSNVDVRIADRTALTARAVLGKPGADASSFNLPTGIAIDTQGNIFVSDSFNNRVMRFDPIQK